MKSWIEKSSLNVRCLAVFAVALLALLPGLEIMEITRINCRFALMTSEIAKYGIELFPTLNNVPYTDYPVTVFVLMHLASLGGRFVNMLTMALPTALFCAWTVMMTYRLGEKISAGLGIFGAAFCFLSFEFINIARAPGMDMAVAAAAVTLFYLFYVTEKEGRSKWNYLWMTVLYAAAFAVRGPLGLIMINAVTGGYFIAGKKPVQILVFGISAAVLSLLICFAGYEAVVLSGGRELWESYRDLQINGRMPDSKWVLYYFTDAAGSFAPAYIIGLAVIILSAKTLLFGKADEKNEVVALRRLASWVLLSLLLLSIPGTKHLRYATAVIPPLALAGGYIFMDFDFVPLLTKLRTILRIFFRVMPLAGVLAGIGFVVTNALLFGGLRYSWIPLAVLSALFLVFVRRKYRSDRALILFAAAVFTVISAQLVAPLDARLESSAQFAGKCEKYLRNGEKIYFFRLGPDGDELKLLVNLPPELRFAGKYIGAGVGAGGYVRPAAGEYMFEGVAFSEMDKLPPDTLFLARSDKLDPIAGKRDLEALKRRYDILESGKMGHCNYILFRKKAQ